MGRKDAWCRTVLEEKETLATKLRAWKREADSERRSLMGKYYKSIPAVKRGRGCEYTAKSGNLYKITRNEKNGLFILWAVSEAGYHELMQMESPYDLYVVIEEMEADV